MEYKSILFVEDDEILRENYRDFLQKEFDKVYEANNGQIGYELYKQYKPNVLLLDINLPILNGLDLLEKIRKTDHSTKAIMITGNTNSDFLLKATELKLTKYLIKPVNRNNLKEAISLVNREIQQFQTISKNIINLKENFIWDNTNKTLLKNEKMIALTQQEVQILNNLIKSIPNQISFESLCFNIWDEYHDKNINSLKTSIKKLRRKLPKGTIENIYGIGYKLVT